MAPSPAKRGRAGVGAGWRAVHFIFKHPRNPMNPRIDVERDAGVVQLTMNALPRPSTIDVETCVALSAALRQIAETASDRVVVLRGAGSVFSAGGNLAKIEETISDPPRLLAPLIDRFHEAVLAMRRLPQPLIASVHGAAAGAGFSIAMACDSVIAARSARFVVGYLKIGASSDGGLSFQLVRRLGRQRAFNLCLLTDTLDANAAQEWGLVDRVVNDDALAAETRALALHIATQPAQAVREMKQLLSARADAEFEQHLEREKAAFLRCAATAEFAERVRAFNQRARKS